MGRIVVVVLFVIGSSAAPTQAEAPCWPPPVVGRVTDPFRAPPCRWCAGNRGIEYAVASGTVVRAAATGRVVFAGSVVGVRYVVVRLSSGWRLTYGRLSSTSVHTGEVVIARSPVGTASGGFYFGVRIGDAYVDPEPYLGALVGRRRLIPTDGTRARPTVAASIRCGG